MIISSETMSATIQKVERIRGPGLAILVKRSEGVPFVEGLKRADEKNMVIASSARMSKALVGSNEWKKISDVFTCWTGTMTAYTKPGEKLGATVEYVDTNSGEKWVFPVPKEFQKEKDAILVAEHPDYKVEIDGKNIVVHANVVDLVLKFPAKNGGYMADAKHGIPTDKEVEYSNARYLRRIDQRVGPVARGCDYDDVDGRSGRRGVLLGDVPSHDFGVAVEGDALLMKSAAKLQAAQEPGKVTLTGSDEQVQTALRVLRSQNLI